MKIGILGGSFNPIHKGHIYLALHGYEACNLDQIWIMPSFTTPFKEDQRMATAIERYEMCKLAVAKYPFMTVKDYEIAKKEISYTYLTLQELCENNNIDEFYFIMGADSLRTFPNWKNPDIICNYAKLIVMNRDEYSQDELEDFANVVRNELNGDVTLVHCPKIDISSTDIRRRISNQKDCTEYLSPDVYEYIIEHRLYSSF